MTALDCGFLSAHSRLEHIYNEVVKPVELFGDDEQKPVQLAAIFDSKLCDELNEKLAECVSHTLKGKVCSFYSLVLINEIILYQAHLVLWWVTIYGWVNHFIT